MQMPSLSKLYHHYENFNNQQDELQIREQIQDIKTKQVNDKILVEKTKP